MTDIEILERAKDYVGIHYVNGVEDAYISPCLLKAIDKAIDALREQPRWIPVTERLPDVWKEVITHRTGGDLSIEFRCSGEGWSFDNDIMGEVTHWIQLPQPPKEGF